MKHILIPTDFSENSWNAITYALAFFERKQCIFYFLHVIEDQPASNQLLPIQIISGKNNPSKNNIDDPKKALDELIEKTKQSPHHPKHSFVAMLEKGTFVNEVRNQIKEYAIDLIVIGTKGATAASTFTIGSHAANVIRQVKCPVLVVPEAARYRRPQHIALATDYHIFFEERMLKTLSQSILLTDATLKILHITTTGKPLSAVQERNKEFLDCYLNGVVHSFHTVTDISIEQAIEKFVLDQDIDIIAMVAKNLNFFQRVLFHPTLEKISYHATKPFMVLHE